MGNLFNMDNPFFSAMGKICDMLFLSIAWAILCIPIITIGPATTAMYYATVKVIRRERSYLFREFFHSFKQNFKQGAIVTIILALVCFVIVGINRTYAEGLMQTEEKKGFILLSIYNAMTIIIIFFVIYIFPILSRFTMSVKQLFKVTFTMAIRHLPSTILMTLITVAFAFCTYYIKALIFIAPVLCTFINSFFLEKIFKKYMPKSEGNPEETGVDEWYLE